MKNWKETFLCLSLILVVTSLITGMIVHYHHLCLKTESGPLGSTTITVGQNIVQVDVPTVLVAKPGSEGGTDFVEPKTMAARIEVNFNKNTITINGVTKDMKQDKGSFILYDDGDVLNVKYGYTKGRNEIGVSYNQNNQSVSISKAFKVTTIKFIGTNIRETYFPFFIKGIKEGRYYLQVD